MSSPSSSGTGWTGSQPTVTMPAVGSEPHTAPRPTKRTRPRRARLVIARVDPWSVMKLSFLLAIGMAVMGLVAVVVLWSTLDSMGVFDAVGRTVESVTRASDTEQGVDINAYVGLERVLTVTALIAGVNIVLMTALATLGAFLYNLAASLVGGLHVTLTEDV